MERLQSAIPVGQPTVVLRRKMLIPTLMEQ